MSRMVDLNGGIPFQGRSNAVLKEFRVNYPNLSGTHLKAMGRKYQADYYLTVRERLDLKIPLVYSNDSYYLYQLTGR